MNELLRGTGRTTRLIREAKRLTDGGHAVYVVGATELAKHSFEELIDDDRIEVTTAHHFDWQKMCPPDAHRNAVVLVDHYAIESRFARPLEMLHRFDPPIIRGRMSRHSPGRLVIPHPFVVVD